MPRGSCEDGEKMQLSYAVQNTHRTIGTRTSSHIVQRFGMRNSLQPDHLTVKLSGSAGQSLGAFAAPGLKLEVSGDANDYVGKGLSGGMIVVRPPMASPLVPHENTIIGNTVLYGATAGYLFAAGRAGERFAVRNSGAKVVIEGCGSNGCEYMTGGVAVILGRIGANFGAGMTGGMAYLYDPEGLASSLMNMETLVTVPVTVAHWENELKRLIERHVDETASPRGQTSCSTGTARSGISSRPARRRCWTSCRCRWGWKIRLFRRNRVCSGLRDTVLTQASKRGRFRGPFQFRLSADQFGVGSCPRIMLTSSIRSTRRTLPLSARPRRLSI